jgi:regulator of sigma E protease
MGAVNLLAALIILGVLIFVHELGHFLVAKLCGVKVEKFSLGFGRKILGRRIGETDYLISVFPLGGYVKMLGESDEGEIDPADAGRSFSAKPPMVRFCIVAAGPTFNLIFAYLAFIVVLLIGFPLDSTKIGSVVKGKPAATAGIMPGDVVVSVDGKKVEYWDEMATEIIDSKGATISLGLRRGSQTVSVAVPPEVASEKNLLGEKMTRRVIGVVRSDEKIVKKSGPGEAVVLGFNQTVNLIRLTLVMMVKLVERAIPLDNIGGPIMIVAEAGKQAAAGGANFLFFMAALSVNLGVLNLLPIPVLDGGHLLFTLMEAIFRRPVSMKVREAAQQVGLILLISLMILAFYNDIIRYFFRNG